MGATHLSASAREQKKARMTAAINASTMNQGTKDEAHTIVTGMAEIQSRLSHFSPYRSVKKNAKDSSNPPILSAQLLVYWANAENLHLLRNMAKNAHGGSDIGTKLNHLELCTKDVNWEEFPQVESVEEDHEEEPMDPEEEPVDPHEFYKVVGKTRKRVVDSTMGVVEREKLHQCISNMSIKFAKVAKSASEWERKATASDKLSRAMMADGDSHLVSENTALATDVARAKDRENALEKDMEDLRGQLEAQRTAQMVASPGPEVVASAAVEAVEKRAREKAGVGMPEAKP
jgi:hypothetical protein